MDVISEVLKTVTLKGAVFHNAEFSAPWSFQSPPSTAIAPYVGSGVPATSFSIIWLRKARRGCSSKAGRGWN